LISHFKPLRYLSLMLEVTSSDNSNVVRPEFLGVIIDVPREAFRVSLFPPKVESLHVESLRYPQHGL
jgi:hypothetical protein